MFKESTFIPEREAAERQNSVKRERGAGDDPERVCNSMELAHRRPHEPAIGARVEQERHGERAVALSVEARRDPEVAGRGDGEGD